MKEGDSFSSNDGEALVLFYIYGTQLVYESPPVCVGS